MNEATSVQQETGQASGRAGSSVFEASSEPGAGAGIIALFVLSIVLVFGGFYVMSMAFGAHEFGIEVFAAGLLLDTIGFFLAFTSFRNR